ncbi:MAG: threonine synthase [Hyphomicrobiales bacterium]
MRYVSTRGEAPELGFEDVLLTGLAPDGGLYVPKAWPSLGPGELEAMRGRPYTEFAFAVIAPFVGGAVPASDLQAMIARSYESFGHPAVAPLRQLDANLWLLELFHGPTLAFKDIAMQLVARLMDWALDRGGRRSTILAATSGDTGAAAVEAFRSSDHATLFVLHPKGRISDVQRRQMTTVKSDNVYNIAVEGTFDDCQAIVKALFGDGPFRTRTALSGVNSINWARIVAQAVYYVFSALALGAPARRVNFTVPTGNFGDIYAGYVAKRMGAPIERLVIATNENDILDRTMKTGRYEMCDVRPTSSPSMDIQVSSNFERLLFEASGRDSGSVRAAMNGLSQSGGFTIPEASLARARRDFSSGTADESDTVETIRTVFRSSGETIEPHTAVGLKVARESMDGEAMISLATAHPAKFPDAVEKATGIRPALPPRLAGLMVLEERMSVLPSDAAAVKTFILDRIDHVS